MVFDTESYFKNLATVNTWGFSYGRKDYQNIYDITKEIVNKLANTEFNTILYCHELNQDPTTGIVNLEILLAKDSDFKEGSYEKRNQTHILPMKILVDTKILDKMDCEFDIKRSIFYDRINEFDKNLDGVLANISIDINPNE